MSTTEKADPVAVTVGCAAVLGVPFLTAWILMLAMGALHSAVPAVPAWGYWTVFPILLGLNVLVAIVRKAIRR